MANEQLEDIKKILGNHEARLQVLEKLFAAKPETIQKKMSINEFILSKMAKSEKDKTLAIAYYLEKYEGLAVFNVKDLEDIFHNAKEPMPKNINLPVIRNIQKGYLMESREKKDDLKAWNLTNTGIKRVEENFKEEE